jgi:hypothetical protein
MTATTKRTIRVWGDTVSRKRCEFRSCNQYLWLAQHVRTGKFMVFEGEPAPLFVQVEIGTGREEWAIDAALVHWDKCPGAARFRNRKRKGMAHVD